MNNFIPDDDDDDESKMSVCVSVTLTAAGLSEVPNMTKRTATLNGM
jgi:hypothetical protein